ncbi:hypothetical protein SLA2020_296610 [Shorea laevis]
MPNLAVIQLDNNNFDGASIPRSFGNIPTLLKLSLRNCNLQGSIPDLSGIPNLHYLDLSSNKLGGPIPTNKLSENITTIDLSNNNLTGSIPANFSGLPLLQKLLLANNSLNGSISSSLWQNRALNAIERLTLDLENNFLVNILGSSDLPSNVTLWLKGNPICSNGSLVKFCKSQTENETRISTTTNSTIVECKPQSCPYEYSPTSPLDCFCAEPLLIGFRLKSPSFSDFIPYKKMFEGYLIQGLSLSVYQLYIYSFAWQEGPRLGMYLKLYPMYDNTTNNHLFNPSEVRRIKNIFTEWRIPLDGIFGPYELINFTLSDVYKDEFSSSLSTGISKGALVGIILGTFTGVVTLSAIISLIIFKRHLRGYHAISKRRQASRSLLKIDGVKSFTYGELALATNNFDIFAQIGQGKIKEPLSFARRLRIALGSSKGILYLHTEVEPPIFHRDIKASNILLDSKFVAKVANFGLSRLAPVPDIDGAMPAHVSTVVKGTPGYVDPEYFLTHLLTNKSDVYSLGVVFLELLTGMQPISHGKNLVREVNIAYQSGIIFSIIDEKLGSYPSECVEKFVNLAMKCCQDESNSRPSMIEVVQTLETIGLMMPEYSDPLLTESVKGDLGKTSTTPPSSTSSMMKNPYMSSDVFGSNLVSGSSDSHHHA